MLDPTRPRSYHLLAILRGVKEVNFHRLGSLMVNECYL